MKQTVCLLLATLVVFQLCTFIYAAPYETSEKGSESESNTGDSGGSYGAPGFTGSSGSSGSGGSQSGSSNTESHISGSLKDESTGKGSGMLMDKITVMYQWFTEMKDKIPFTDMINKFKV